MHFALVLCIIDNIDEAHKKEERSGQNSLKKVSVKEVH